MGSSYRNSLDTFLANLEIDCDTLIDVGGSQLGLERRVKELSVKKYLVADLPNPHEDSAKPDIELDLNQIDSNLRGEADIVTCFEVMEYVWHAPNAFANIAGLLKSGGVAYVSFPTFYPLHNPVEDDSLRYMPSGIQKLANYANLEVLDMTKRRPETHALQNYFSAERLRAAKGEDHNFFGLIVKLRKG